MARRIVLVVYLLIGLSSYGQSPMPTFGTSYSKPLSLVLHEVSHRFGVRIKVPTPSDTAGLVLRWADARWRPWSVEATLRGVLSPFDLQALPQPNGSWRVAPYHYPRRTPEEGRLMLEWLTGLYPTLSAWEARRDTLRADVARRMGLSPLTAQLTGKVQLGKPRKHDGYTARNFRLPTADGWSVCGTIYEPLDTRNKSKEKREKTTALRALIVSPAGHFAGGRYNEALQLRYGTLARMGSVCISYDTWGGGQSAEEIAHRELGRQPTAAEAKAIGSRAHVSDTAHRMQTLNGLAIIDMALRQLRIDAQRVGVCGFSGGGSQTVLLGLLEPRVTAVCPVVSLAAWFDGGCPCESGVDIHRAAGGTCNPELLACFAPKPAHVVSDSGDWTRTVPGQEMPYLRHVWSLYNAADRVTNTHLEGERHDAGPGKRNAVYQFFAQEFGLDTEAIDESRVAVESEAELRW